MTINVPRKVLYVFGAIAVIVGAGVLGAAAAGGGGDGETVTVVETVTEQPGEEEAEAVSEEGEEGGEGEEVSEEGDCDELGINREVGNEGRCTREGVELVVVDKGSLLKLRELNVRLLSMKTTDTVSGEFGESKTANGTFVIFDLEVLNKANSPMYFDDSQEQVYLYLGDNEYTEDFEVENYVLDDSFVNKFEEVQPETATTGTVAFDIPPKLVGDLQRNGNLAIFNFSDAGEAGAATQSGIIRTYK